MDKLLSKLLQNPLFRLIGVLVILYYALFTNTYKSDSLGNRLSKKNVEKNLSDIKEKGVFIAENLRNSEVEKKNLVNKTQPENHQIQESQNIDNENNKLFANKVIIKDIANGRGSEAKCGDEVTLDYLVFDNNGNKLDEVKNKIIKIIDDGKSSIIKENIAGIKDGGKRIIILPVNFRTSDEETNKYLKNKEDIGINYQIEMLKVNNLHQIHNKCSWSNQQIIAPTFGKKGQ